jgi:hypothetical protein
MLSSPPVVLNEVFYDPAGADAGFQFVELFNRAEQAVSLAGWRLEAGDGAGAERWRTLWTGTAADVVPPRALFVLGEGRVEPAPDRVLAFDLENGPDAVRLSAPDGARDVLGYGALTWASYFEARPAPDVAAGFALARLPDGKDGDDNAADWSAVSPPSPGRPNLPERDVAVARAALAAERVEAQDAVTAHATVANRGATGFAAREVEARLWAAPLAAASLAAGGLEPIRPDSLVARAELAELEAGDSLAVTLAFVPPAPGPWRVTVAATTLDDGVPANDRVELVAQVGPGELLFTEVAAAPADGPEWVEVVNVGGSEVVLEGWTLEDATGRRGRMSAGVAGGAWSILAESLLVVTADPAALVALHPALDPHRVVACAPWPSLNNDPPSGSPAGTPADRLVLRPPDGPASDALDLPAALPERTRERRSPARPTRDPANWSASAVRGGTPGRANSVAASPAGPGVALDIAPTRRPYGSAEPLLVTWRTGFERAHVTLVIYDVRGRRVRLLLDEPEAPGAAGAAWDGADDAGRTAPPGLYLVGLDAKSAGGAAHARTRAWLSVE